MFIFGGGSPSEYQISRSLRFNSADSAYLNRTQSTPTSATTFTFSAWVKLGALGAGCALISAGTAYDSNFLMFWIDTSDKVNVTRGDIGFVTTVGVLRDPTSWYHIVVAFDTSQATGSDRIKIYINGVQQSLTTSNTVALNATFYLNANTRVACIGREGVSPASYLSGYLAECYFIDGQQLTPSSFGETSTATNTWGPKVYSGSYGNNGFYLDFSDNSNTTSSTLGKDRSGNNNDWTPNNFSVTAGVGNDSLVDTPTNYGTDTGAGGEVRGNYCVWNPIWSGASAPTNGNLDSPSAGVARGNFKLLDFDAYWELTSTGGTSTAGAVSESGTTNTTTVANGKTYGFRLTTTGTLDYKNITDAGAWTNIASSLSGVQYPYTSGAASTVASLNAGQHAFAATAPTGFKALCTQNLSTPAIARGDDYFAVDTYTGTGATRSKTGVRFQPDLAWFKGRSGATDHAIYDSVRGAEKRWETNTADDEVTSDGGLTAFNSDGYTIGTLAQVNTSSATYVAWLMKKGATPGFDVVSYTGNGANRTISHACGVAPSLVIVKARTTASTDQAAAVWHSGIANTEYLVLNSTATKATGTTYWNSTSPTSSVFSVGTAAATNTNSDTYIAYLFAEVAGFSKISTYTGNGSADGPFVWCGFKPRWLIIKLLGTGDWWIYDSARKTYNPLDEKALANSSAATDTSGEEIDVTANGFKVRSTATGINTSSGTHCFAAFAETPFKYARAG